MINVRRTMTEILLKVTNREIEAICREELQRYYKKHKGIGIWTPFCKIKIKKIRNVCLINFL